MATPFNLAKYLRREAIRFVRTKYAVPWLLGEELYTVFRNIRDDTTGPGTITPLEGEPWEFPDFPDFEIPPFDLDFPEFPPYPIPEESEGEGTDIDEDECWWTRTTVIGQIKSRGEENTSLFNVMVYPYGFLEDQCGEGVFLPTNPDNEGIKSLDVEAEVTDESLVDSVDLNTWVMVFRVAQWEKTVQPSGAVEIRELQHAYYFNAPQSAGGKAAVVTETITGREGTTPGKGQATIYNAQAPENDPNTGEPPEDATPTLAAGNTVDVYNIVTADIEAGEDGQEKWIQVKKIDGFWFVDVEDCSSGQ